MLWFNRKNNRPSNYVHFRKFENSTLQLTWSGLKNNETYTANLSLTSDLSPKEPF